jgi:hypothetical protein
MNLGRKSEIGHRLYKLLKRVITGPISSTRILFVLQLVRQASHLNPSQQKNNVARSYTARESFLSSALLSVLSVNVFLLSGVLSFCTFVFWYPQ